MNLELIFILTITILACWIGIIIAADVLFKIDEDSFLWESFPYVVLMITIATLGFMIGTVFNSYYPTGVSSWIL